MDGLGAPRAMRWIAPAESTEWPANCKDHEELCAGAFLLIDGARASAHGRTPAPAPASADTQTSLRPAQTAVLRKVAVNREVMAAVANSYAPGLQGFLDAIKKLNIPNFMVIAIDKPLADNLQAQGVPYYFRENAAQGNHKERLCS